MAEIPRRRPPKLAVWKFASCDGCQLSLLDCEDELLALASEVEIAYFPEASRMMVKGPYDLSLVEGSITTPHDAERIKEVRGASKYLVTIGACATAGGIQALRNFKDVEQFISVVYASPEYIDVLATSTPISNHVPVDFELRGTVCVMVAHGTPCLGPVTHAGCGAICPAYNRGCYGCYGPKETPNTASLSKRWIQLGATKGQVMRTFRSFNACAEPFLKESEHYENEEDPGRSSGPRRR